MEVELVEYQTKTLKEVLFFFFDKIERGDAVHKSSLAALLLLTLFCLYKDGPTLEQE